MNLQRIKLPFKFIFCLLFINNYLWADIIVLNDGTILSGKIIEKIGSQTVISNTHGTFTIPAFKIKSITQTKSFEEDVEHYRKIGRAIDTEQIKLNYETGMKVLADMDTQPPAITTFHLKSPSPTTSVRVSLIVDGNDNVGVSAWLINEVSQKPGPDDPGWQAAKPDFYLLSPEPGVKKIYAWAKDKKGHVSSRSPLTELRILLNKRGLHFLLSASFVYFFSGGEFNEVLDSGLCGLISFDTEFTDYIFDAKPFFFPDIRVQAGYLYFGGDNRNFWGIPLLIGPVWYLPIISGHQGRINMALTQGTSIFKINGERDGERVEFWSPQYTLSFLLGYSYYFNVISLFINANYLYIYDANHSLNSIGIEAGCGYYF